MPERQRVEAFMATVEAGDYLGAIVNFYARDASMRENTSGPPRVGRDVLLAHEQGVMSAFSEIAARRQAPPVISGDQVAIRWRFAFRLPQGERVLEEIAWQTWRGGEIVEEVFFYDPGQMAAVASAA
jgi:hypothetical protein